MPLLITKPFFASSSSGNEIAYISRNQNIQTYNFASGVVETLVATIGYSSQDGSCFSESTRGIYVQGNYNPTLKETKKLTFADDTITSGNNLSQQGRSTHKSASNSTVGIISGGVNSGTYQANNYVDIFTFANETIQNGVNLIRAKRAHNAGGNTTLAVFSGGSDSSQYTATSERYHYATNSRDTSATLGDGRDNAGTGGDDTISIIAGGSVPNPYYTNYVDKFNFSAETTQPGTVLSLAKTTPGGASNKTKVLFAGGHAASGSTGQTDEYLLSDDTIATGTTMTIAGSSAGMSNCHGGLA